MPTLRSSKSRIIDEVVDQSKGEPANLKSSLSSRTLSKQYQKLIMSISPTDIKKSLKYSPSEAKFYSSICEAELKKLEDRRAILDIKIKAEDEYRARKNAEASQIIGKLLEETSKRLSGLPNKSKLKKCVGLEPDDFKRVFNEAKKLSENLKMKKKKQHFQRMKLSRQIKLAKNTMHFCMKYMNQK